MTLTPQPTTARSNALNIAGNALIALLFLFLAIGAVNGFLARGDLSLLLLAIQELLIVVLAITRRRPIAGSNAIRDWVLALAGTAAPLLLRSAAPIHPALLPVGVAVQTLGVALAVLATWSLGRSFGIVAANRGVRTAGMYRFVRHPLYGSYLIGHIGFLLGNISVANVILIVVTVTLQYLRAVVEEQFLLRDPAYQAYAARVRHRFIPFLF